MDNRKNIISKRNKRIKNFYYEINGKICNCRNKKNCPLDNKCKKNVKIDRKKLSIKLKLKPMNYINELSAKVNFGISEIEFIFMHNNHTMPFRNQTHENDFKLSKFICSLKDQSKEFDN